ncbi:MAG: aldehyde dehydrogenase family protein [Planctomycetota bacterium]
MPTASLIPDLASRRDALRRARSLLAAHADELIAVIESETNKPPFEALSSEILPLLSVCGWHRKHAARVLRDRRTPGKPLWLLGVRHRVARRPLGRVAIIATWNYPVQLVGVQIIQAFMGGNEILVKPSERSPATQNLLLDLFGRAGIATERIDASPEAGEAMVREADFDHLVFTGSTGVGRAIARVLAERLIPSTLELSGNDSAVVLPSADPALAARCIWYALTLNHGQTCMAPHRVLVAEEVRDRFLEALRAAAADAEPRKLIDEASTERCRAVAREAVDAGGELIAGDPDADPLSAIVIADAPPGSRLHRGEHFGPLLSVRTLTDDIEPADPLTVSVFGEPSEARHFAALSRAGTILINDCIIPTGHPGAPLSAAGDSGWGVSRGVEGLLAMTRPTAISSTNKKIRLPLDPPATPVASITPWLRRLYPLKGTKGNR